MFKRIKAFFDERIKRAVRRELTNIFREYGDVSVDHHLHSDSWAVIKVDKGPHSCYLKFIDLGKRDLRDIQHYLSMFERKHIDSTPQIENEFDRMFGLF